MNGSDDPMARDRPKLFLGRVLISVGPGPYHSFVTPLPMMKHPHTFDLDRRTTESLGVAMSFARLIAIPSVNNGWSFTLGSGVT